jgi:RPA family protein
MQEKAAEVEEAVKTLNELGENISRDKLLDVIIAAPNETRVDAFVSLARGAMDYQFFQMLSDKIEAAEGDEKEKLTSLREQLLKSVDEIDKAIQARLDVAKQNIDRILSVDNMKEIVMANLNAMDEFFMQALALELAEAEKNEDKDRLEKLNLILEVLNEAAESAKATQVDVELIQELIEADDENRAKLFEERKDDITPKLIEGLTGAMMQVENAEGQEELAEKLRAVYKDAIKISMQNMKDS